MIQDKPFFDATLFSNLTELHVFPIDNDFKEHIEESKTKEVTHLINSEHVKFSKQNLMQENLIIQHTKFISNCAKEHINTYQPNKAKAKSLAVCQQKEIQKPMVSDIMASDIMASIII